MIEIHNRYGNGAYYVRNQIKHDLPSDMFKREQRIKIATLEDAQDEQEELIDWLANNSISHPDWDKKIQQLSQSEITIRRLEFVRSPVNTASLETINIIR